VTTITELVPTGAAITVELERVENRLLKPTPQPTYTEFDARYPGRARRDGTRQQDGCVPPIEQRVELRWEDGERTPSFKHLSIRVSGSEAGRAVALDIAQPAQPLSLRGAACVGDTVYLVLLPWPFTGAEHDGQLVAVGRDGALRSVRPIHVPGLGAMRPFGEKHLDIVPLGLFADGDDLVLHLADHIEDRGPWVTYTILHVYRLRGALAAPGEAPPPATTP
jgi:hypothetical protein